MRYVIVRQSLFAVAMLVASGVLRASGDATADAPARAPVAQARADGIDIALGDRGGTLSLRFVAPSVLRVHYHPHGTRTPEAIVVDPHAALTPLPAQVRDSAERMVMSTDALAVTWNKDSASLSIADAQEHVLLHQDNLDALRKGRIVLRHAPGDALYGIGGYTANDGVQAGLLRSGVQVAEAGEQGHAGAPFVWSTAGYGVLVDAATARFELADGRISVDDMQRPDIDYFIMVGDPPQLFADLADLSGHPPMFPKWAMGFTNSQWGIDQQQLLKIVDIYRARHIPIDSFTLDFDWKAWGEDNYGEFRWNADKFPGGPNGKLKAELDRRGIHLSGIMKPRIHVDTVEGRYATAHHLWWPGEPATKDYFSHQLVKDLDFDKPATRAWFFNDALKHSFDTGMVGWWNDEADTTGSNTQFLNMQRSLYDGQRAYSRLRVWSINRNFWLGAQRYAYGLWSGDIDTGFKSMAAQRARMLSAIGVGEMKWGMDAGGFNGHPSAENYARWVQFGAFTPIFRVHGTFGEKRQPWRYGKRAEKAATAAIRLRYALIPYIYAYERRSHVDGVGLVRPLTFGWPEDTHVRNDVDAWMFGDWLLVSPVVEQGQTSKDIYLPAGTWTDWFSGKVYKGGDSIHIAVDAQNWDDIPLFIRQGAIIPTQEVLDYVGQKPITTVEVEVFPAATRTHFDYYDDDGDSYAYEHGAYFEQRLAAQRDGERVTFATAAPTGSFKPPLKHYLVKVHGARAAQVDANAARLRRYDSLEALRNADGQGWAAGSDRYGDVTWLRLDAGQPRDVALSMQPPTG